MNAAPGLLLCLIGAVLMSGQVEAVYVPLRCACPKVTEVVKEPLSDINVIEKGPHCKNDEIIVTLKAQAGDGQPINVCLNPSGKQAKQLLKCLERMAKSNKEKKQCLQPQKRRPKHKRNQTQKLRQTSKRSRGTKQRALQS
ncbi:alveolar macrophage chemotactic factor [Brienomyrus brachyistius]|uniref:alveolar macrophage chemotactic factor n=1 Tax=Brienomyrus brachyistius TaxID=42636 RepID=UPI0020B3DC89|nr:alveolar macrophage chemotactic factor [Brienomyrus brachyistius]